MRHRGNFGSQWQFSGHHNRRSSQIVIKITFQNKRVRCTGGRESSPDFCLFSLSLFSLLITLAFCPPLSLKPDTLPFTLSVLEVNGKSSEESLHDSQQ